MNVTLGNATDCSSGVSGGTQLIIQIAFNCILTLGLPINIYVMRLILSGAGETITSEFFYLNLTASVTVFCLVPAPSTAWLFTGNCILQNVCYFFLFLFLFSVPSFQGCICVERYLAVVHPVVFLRYKALRYRVGCCCVEWLKVFVFSLLWFGAQTVLFYFLVGYNFVCISVVSFCCLSVLRALKQPGPGEGQRNSGEGNDMKSRAFKIILISLIVMVLTIVGFIPFCLTILEYSDSSITTIITYSIGIMTVYVHPLLYIHKTGKLPCFKGL